MNRITYHILPLIERTLASAPVDWRSIFEKAGLPALNLGKKAPAYIELDDLFDAFAMAVDQSGDDHLVLRYYDIRAWSFYPTLYSGLISLASDMREIIAIYRRYGQLHTTGYYQLYMRERGGYCEMEFELRDSRAGGQQFLDFQMMMTNSVSMRLSDRGFPGLKLDLTRKECQEELYERHYPHIKIRCGMPVTRLYGDTEFFHRRFRADSTRLPQVLQERAEREIQMVDEESGFLRELRVLLVGTMGTGDLTSDFAARRMGMSRRSFYRKLEAEGLTFQKVLDEVRHENALRFLLESDRDFEDIALLLGFSGEASFRRFFRGVENMTPVQYRKKYK